jgi:hypothetical protein
MKWIVMILNMQTYIREQENVIKELLDSNDNVIIV